MPARERQGSLPPTGITEDAASVWMREVTLNMEQLSGRVIVVEKSVDTLAIEVRRATDVSQISAQALERIAKAEEERAAAAKEQNKLTRENQKLAERWAGRVWGSPAFQMLLTGTVMAALQFMGVAYIMNRLPPVELPTEVADDLP